MKLSAAQHRPMASEQRMMAAERSTIACDVRRVLGADRPFGALGCCRSHQSSIDCCGGETCTTSYRDLHHSPIVEPNTPTTSTALNARRPLNRPPSHPPACPPACRPATAYPPSCPPAHPPVRLLACAAPRRSVEHCRTGKRLVSAYSPVGVYG